MRRTLFNHDQPRILHSKYHYTWHYLHYFFTCRLRRSMNVLRAIPARAAPKVLAHNLLEVRRTSHLTVVRVLNQVQSTYAH